MRANAFCNLAISYVQSVLKPSYSTDDDYSNYSKEKPFSQREPAKNNDTTLIPERNYFLRARKDVDLYTTTSKTKN